MNLTSHPVAPEEIMAYVDGELSASETAAVDAHVKTCAECAGLIEEFRDTSRFLSRWSVPAIPAQADEDLQWEIARATRNGSRVGRKRRWKPWLIAGGSLAAVCVLALFAVRTSLPGGRRAFITPPRHEEMDLLMPDAERRSALMMLKAPPAEAKMHAEALDFAASSFDAHSGPSDIAAAPMIARTVSVNILVQDIAAARPVLDAIVGRHHGYAAQLNVNAPEGGARGFDTSLRIPAPELTAALGEMRGLGRVERETQSAEEVSQQHADLLARLKNSRETEERFQAILRQRTGSVSDVMEVEEGIARVRGEIEQMEAEQRTLEHRVDYAKVDVELTEEYKASLAAPGDSLGTRLHNAAVSGYENASGTVVGIVLFFAAYGPAILIWVAILGLPLWLVRRRYRAKRAAKP